MHAIKSISWVLTVSNGLNHYEAAKTEGMNWTEKVGPSRPAGHSSACIEIKGE
jgi:hypothetical protein